MLNSSDNILHKPIENKFNIQTCPYAELLLTYVIKFETGRCSHHEVDAHQRKDTCSQMYTMSTFTIPFNFICNFFL